MKVEFIKNFISYCVLCITLPIMASTKDSRKVRLIIDKVNTYWQQNHNSEVSYSWDNAAYHTGNMEAYYLTGNKKYYVYSENWAKHNQWMGAKSNNKKKWQYFGGETDDDVLCGNNQVCFQTYIDLYNLVPENYKKSRAIEVMEYQINTSQVDYWWWSDGLFMAMPVMTKLYKVTNNNKYLDKLYEYIKYTDSIMFDKKENLYFRDAKYVYPKHKSLTGKKDFWARGDGWAFAGLAKVLKDLPDDYEHRDFFFK